MVRFLSLPKVALIILLISVVLIFLRVSRDLNFTMASPVIALKSVPSLAGEQVRLAVISDLHISYGAVNMEVVKSLLKNVVNQRPHAVLLIGDYIGQFDTDLEAIRSQLADELSQLSKEIPVFLVLGNHDVRTGEQAWLQAFRAEGVSVLDNEIVESTLNGLPTCVRGLGDFLSGQFEYVDWPTSCAKSLKITITHDPAAAFLREYDGIVFSGHTHCGQGVLPIVGPPWVPTTAPRKAICGLYQDEDRVLYVSSGVGTSILPVRFFAPSQWDHVTLKLQ